MQLFECQSNEVRGNAFICVNQRLACFILGFISETDMHTLKGKRAFECLESTHRKNGADVGLNLVSIQLNRDFKIFFWVGKFSEDLFESEISYCHSCKETLSKKLL